MIVCLTPPQINDFCDLLGTLYAPVSKIAPVKSLLYSYIYCALLEVAKKGLSLTCAQLLVFVVVMRVLLS